MAGLTIARLRFSPAQLVITAFCVLFLFGILLALMDLGGLGNAESRRANAQGQRAVIDPVTGSVALTPPEKKPASEFDVETGESPAGKETPATDAATTEPTADGESPAAATDEPATTQEVPSAGETMPQGLTALRTTPLSTELPKAESAKESLVPAPAPEISEKLDGMILPKRGSNKDDTPALIYSRHFKMEEGQHRVSIVILDAGVSAQSLPLIMALPKNVTVAVSPYATNITTQIATLRRAGYEVWNTLPTVTDRYPQDDPGPLGLVATLPKEELTRRVQAIMSDMLGSVGMVLLPNEALTGKASTFSIIAALIDARGLALLATKPATGSNDGIHHADILLDPAPDEAAIEAALESLTKAAEEKEHVIAIASARPQTLLLLQRWFQNHPLAEPAILAPLSAQFPGREPPPPPAEEASGGHGGGHGGGEKKPEAKTEKKPETKPSEGGHH